MDFTAGYVHLPVIDTVEGLDALTPRSIILDGDGIGAWRKRLDGFWREDNGDTDEAEDSHTVLWQSSRASVFVLYIEPANDESP